MTKTCGTLLCQVPGSLIVIRMLIGPKLCVRTQVRYQRAGPQLV